MTPQKIINDPVYGFISISRGDFLKVVDHPWFQRLRRIKQGGFSHLVYPGATHTRFHHTLGAFHLTKYALRILIQKGVSISDEEIDATLFAILFHDLGHGPFSHSLEHHLLPVSHEAITYAYVNQLNLEFNGRFELALKIFDGSYEKKFLCQLISSQLDMDRMDYLTRDSFFTGVAEGVIGYDRIIEMLNVADNQLVVEEKSLYSIEKFLMSRRLMYWQVYYHKTVISAEQMLISYIKRLRSLLTKEPDIEMPGALRHFLENELAPGQDPVKNLTILEQFSLLDDHDIIQVLKSSMHYAKDKVLKSLSNSLLNRTLFKVQFFTNEEERTHFRESTLSSIPSIEQKDLFSSMYLEGKVVINPYQGGSNEIHIIDKNHEMVDLSKRIQIDYLMSDEIKYYLAYPRL